MPTSTVKLIIEGSDRASRPLHIVTQATATLGRSVSALTVAMGNLMAQGVTALTRALGNLAGAGAQAVEQFQSIEASMRTLIARELVQKGMVDDMAKGLDAASAQVQEYIKWVERLSLESPFSAGAVADIFRGAMAFGFTAKQAQSLTETVLNTTAALGLQEAELDGIMRAIGQIYTRGTLQMEEVNQLTERAVPVLQILQQEYGKTGAEIISMISKGQIAADEAISAIQRALDRDFGGAAARMSGTLAGLKNSLSDIWSLGAMKFLRPALEEAMPSLNDFIDTLSGPGLSTLERWGQRFGEVFAAGIETFNLLQKDADEIRQMDIISILHKLMPDADYETLKERSSSILNTFRDISGVLSGEISPVELLPKEWQTTAEHIRDRLFEVRDVIREVISTVQSGGSLPDIFRALGLSPQAITDIMKAVWTLRFTFTGFVQTLEETLQPALTDLKAAWQEFANVTGLESLKASDVLKVAVGIILGLLQGLLTLVAGVVTGVTRMFTSLIQGATSIAQGWKNVFDGIRNYFSGLWTVISGIFTGNMEKIRAGAQQLATGFTQIWTGLWNVAKGVFQQSIGAIIGFFEGFWQSIVKMAEKLKYVLVGGSIIPDMMDAIKQTIQRGLDAVLRFFGDIFDRVIGKARDFAAKLKSRISSAISDAKSAVLSKIGEFVSAGESLIDGLRQGFSNMAGRLVEKAKSIANSAINAVKQTLQIGSPSKVFIEVGEDTFAGYIKGLENMRKETERAMSATINGAIRATNRHAPAAVSAAGGGNVYNFYITESSDPRRTAREIGRLLGFRSSLED